MKSLGHYITPANTWTTLEDCSKVTTSLGGLSKGIKTEKETGWKQLQHNNYSKQKLIIFKRIINVGFVA